VSISARERALEAFRVTFHREPDILVRSPGRVNLLGEHVDYNEGWVMPAALTRAAWVAAARADEPRLDVLAADLAHAEGGARAVLELGTQVPREVGGWPAYPAGVAWALGQAGFEVCGLNAVLASDVPIGSGLSSSAAVEVGFAWAWRELCGLPLDRVQIARWCQRAENEFVGVASGIMDQFTVACAQANRALWLDCRDLSYTTLPLPAGAAIVIADSRAPRTLAGSAYNERRAECEQGLRLLSKHLPGIRALRDVSPEECARVLAAQECLIEGDVAAFGEAMRASHVSLRDDYAVSSRELDALAEAAWEVPGCYGSRLTGAGFGGCTVSLVADDAVEPFIAHVSRRYAERTGREALVYVEHAAAGVALED
jgi:galactokinase